MPLLLTVIAIFASSIGAITGMGGGIIIKPLMDALSGLPIHVINFMSGCTVLSMAIFSCFFRFRAKVHIDIKIVMSLALGSVIGGFFGNSLLMMITTHLKLIQSSSLLIINLCVMLYTIHKHKLHTYTFSNVLIITFFGIVLGTISSFLGIGGGPINVAVLHYYFSLPMKIAATNSLFIILLTQISSIGTSFLTNNVPLVNGFHLFLMVSGGIIGAIIGQKISKKISDEQANRLFLILNVGLVLLSGINTLTLLI